MLACDPCKVRPLTSIVSCGLLAFCLTLTSARGGNSSQPIRDVLYTHSCILSWSTTSSNVALLSRVTWHTYIRRTHTSPSSLPHTFAFFSTILHRLHLGLANTELLPARTLRNGDHIDSVVWLIHTHQLAQLLLQLLV